MEIDWRKAQLSNGLRVITVARPGTATVAVRAYVRAGSRYDEAYQQPGAPHAPLGLAHLTEHLLFRGTHSRTQREVFATVERLGGVLEALTAKEYTTVYAVTPAEDVTIAVEMVADVICNPALREQDFWTEKLVVLEEIHRAEDGHGVLFDLFAETLWLDRPLRTRVLGTLEGLQAATYEHLLTFYRGRYVTGNLVVVVCGDIDHEAATRLVAGHFATLPVGPEQPPVRVQACPLFGARTAHLRKDMHQLYLAVGVPTVDMKHKDRSALKVIERVLGMGGSARLYQRLREELRLVYSVNTVSAQYEDAGFLAVQTACDPGKADATRQGILDEWHRLCDQGVSDDELGAAQSNYAGTLTRRFETNLAVAGILGVEELLHQIESFEVAVARINAVDCDEVLRVARKYLDPTQAVTVSVGRQVARRSRPSSLGRCI